MRYCNCKIYLFGGGSSVNGDAGFEEIIGSYNCVIGLRTWLNFFFFTALSPIHSTNNKLNLALQVGNEI